MNIKELILHPAQLKEVELIKAKCEKTELYNPSNLEVSISANLTSENVKENSGNSKIEILIEGEGFNIEVVEIGIFSFDEIDDLEQIKRFLEVQGVKVLWSYVRETVYDFSGKLLRKPIMLPTIDVLKTLEKAEKE